MASAIAVAGVLLPGLWAKRKHSPPKRQSRVGHKVGPICHYPLLWFYICPSPTWLQLLYGPKDNLKSFLLCLTGSVNLESICRPLATGPVFVPAPLAALR